VTNSLRHITYSYHTLDV